MKRICIGTAIVLWLYCTAFSANVPVTMPAIDPALAARVATILKEMDAEEYPVREKASAEAARLPVEALPLLEQAAAGGSSPEVASRLAPILKPMREDALVAGIARRRSDFIIWKRDLHWSDYQNAGHANPKWDAAVREAFNLQSQFDLDPDVVFEPKQKLVKAFGSAVDLGCDDPLVRFDYLQALIPVQEIPADKALETTRPIVKAICEGNYSPLWKFSVQTSLIQRYLDCKQVGVPVDSEMIAFEVAKLAPFYRDAVQIPGLHPDAEYQLGVDLIKMAISDAGDKNWGYQTMTRVIRKSGRPPEELSCLHADYMVWSVQHSLASGVVLPDDATLSEARDELTSISDADPSNLKAAELMLQLCVIQKLPPAEMEKWFGRAIAVNPGDLTAYALKLRYLAMDNDQTPMLAFSHQCILSRFVKQKVGINVGIDAIILGSAWRGDGPNNFFFEQHPEAWGEIKAAFEGYLKVVPNDYRARSKYADFAARLLHWDIASAQLNLLGDNAVLDCFGSKAELQYLKRKIAHQQIH